MANDFRSDIFKYDTEHTRLRIADTALNGELYHVKRMLEEGDLSEFHQEKLANAILLSAQLATLLEGFYEQFYGTRYIFEIRGGKNDVSTY